ncbi:MAG: pyridoxal-phosphate dependent enzyme, partial [Acidobacteria bacterium]|nr:pyridoxal-phosphate dependent enzyme [Acidobacteriota bacterium]
FGVVASEAPSMALSSEAGVPVSTETAQTVADGIAVRVPVALGVERVNAFADEILTVSETSLAEGVRLLHSTTGLVVEPAGAAAVAALLEHGSRFKGLQVAAPLFGGNLDPERLAAILGGP